MPTSIFFNGRMISVPGSYSIVDASGLESVGLGATGIVAVIGTAEGGAPVSAISETKDFLRIKKPEMANTIFRSGNLKDVAPLLFAPAKDPNIPGGAVEVVAMKVNPATQAAAALPNAYGPCLDLTSVDYGAFAGQINVNVGTGTTKGKLLTVVFEDQAESVDDLGGDPMLQVTYDPSTNSWETMTAEVENGGAIVCRATRPGIDGLDTDMTAPIAAASVLIVVSASASDVGMKVVLYGRLGTVVKKEVLTLNGTTPVDGVTVFDTLAGVRIIGVTAGAVTVSSDVPTLLVTVPAGTNESKGVVAASTMYVANGKITMVASAVGPFLVGIDGYSPTGAAQLEMKAVWNVPVDTTGTWSEIAWIILGAFDATETLDLSAEAARTVPATQNTIKKCADYFNARAVTGVGGFTFTLVTGLLSFNPVDLDVTTGAPGPVDCLTPANPAFYADLWAIVSWLNQNSAYVNGAKATGAIGGAPSNTAAPVFLAGGSEGVPSFSDWQRALNLLKKVRVNTVVPLTADPAVHAATEAHCAFMCGVGRNERDAVAGVMNAAMTDVAPKSEIKSQIVDLNSRHVRVVAQAIEAYSPQGERVEYPPYFTAALIAGMQAGSPVGTSLTFKYMNALSLRQHTSWNPTDDAEEMIQAGLCFAESVEGIGRRVVRNVTTYLISPNLAFSEASVNEAANFACWNFRTAMEFAVGKPGFAGTVNAGKGVGIGILGLLVDATILTGYRSLNLELIADVLEVSVEIAPIIPINFIKSVIHLVTLAQTA